MAHNDDQDKKAEQRSDAENIESGAHLSEKIKESARQIWLAGLGAYNKAEEDAGKIFEKLVKEGEEIENKTRGVVEKRIKAVEETVGEVKEKATGTWDKLESVFDQRVSRAINRLGLPSKSDVRELNEKIDKLNEKIKKLEKK
ncbi:MAG: phasin family protein [Hahellaceae bacterium]|jgi:poly(hydroxyalkanoate) granule-associated protein|nr:phasin family protein [Hahellaceae bacterium]MCP5213108.1 phasin family protein [Hahellaceae bacterium]